MPFFQDELSRNPFLPPSATEQLLFAHRQQKEAMGWTDKEENGDSTQRSREDEATLESQKQSES